MKECPHTKVVEIKNDISSLERVVKETVDRFPTVSRIKETEGKFDLVLLDSCWKLNDSKSIGGAV